MNANDFIRNREKDWQQLDQLLNKHKGRSALTAMEVRELGELYRAVTSDLAQARRDYEGAKVVSFLNQLVLRAHNYIYQQDVSDFSAFVRYFTHVLPQTFRQTALFTLASFLLFFVPAVVGFTLAATNPEVATPLGLAEQRAVLEERETWTDIPVEERPYVSAFIMSNNIRVALLAFGGGVTFGLFTAYILAMNGLVIGATLGLSAYYGLGDSLGGFIVGHGFIELSVIFIAGGAGLQMGWALLRPGRYTRRDALALAARRAVTLVLAAIPLLFLAGLIEGFISPSGLPAVVRGGVGISTGVLLYGYLLLAGQRREAVSNPRPDLVP